MRKSIGVSVIMLAIALPASAAVVWSDGLNGPYGPASADVEGLFGDGQGDSWTGDGFEVMTDASTLPAGWKFARQYWYPHRNHTISPDNTLKTEGTASMKISCSDKYKYADIFVGKFITGLTPGQAYTINWDFQADAGIAQAAGTVGQGTGDDHVPAVSWMVDNVTDNPNGWGSTEDYPGGPSEGEGIWISDINQWNGSFHTQTTTFVATAPEMAFVAKWRYGQDQVADLSIRLDNFVVTPEPVSLAMLAMGGLVCLRRRR